jgi:hypothetical protein
MLALPFALRLSKRENEDVAIGKSVCLDARATVRAEPVEGKVPSGEAAFMLQ